MQVNTSEDSSSRLRMRREEIEAEIARIYELSADTLEQLSQTSEEDLAVLGTSPLAFYEVPVIRSPGRDRRRTLISHDSFVQKDGKSPSSSPQNINNNGHFSPESPVQLHHGSGIESWGIITEMKILKSLFAYIEESGDEFIYRAPLKISSAQVESSARSILSGQSPSKYGLRVCCSMVIYIVQNHPNGMVTPKLVHMLQSTSTQECKENLVAESSPQETHDIWFLLLSHLETLIARLKISLTQAASLFADILCKTLKDDLPEEDTTTYNGKLKQLLETEPESEQFTISFQELLMSGGLELMDTLVQLEKKTEVDNLLQHLLHVFDFHGKSELLLQTFVIREIQTSSSNTSILFRTNNFTTKILGRYCKLYGKFFLENTIGKIVKQIQSTKFRTDVFQNIPALQNNKDYNALVQFMIDMIATSASSFPPQLRFMCHTIKDIVANDRKFIEDPSVAYVGVCGIVFLRFLVPAITSPVHYQVIQETLPPEMPKKLALLAGELQSSVNKMTSVVKGLNQEGGARNRNSTQPFINQNTVLLANFCDKISTPVRDPASLPSVVTPEQYKEGIKYVTELFQRNFQTILQDHVKPEPRNEQTYTLLFDFLKMVLGRRSRNVRKLESRTSSGSKPRKLQSPTVGSPVGSPSLDRRVLDSPQSTGSRSLKSEDSDSDFYEEQTKQQL